MESTPRQIGEAEDIAKLLARCHDVEQRVESLLLVNDELVRQDRKSTRLNSSHSQQSRMPSSA